MLPSRINVFLELGPIVVVEDDEIVVFEDEEIVVSEDEEIVVFEDEEIVVLEDEETVVFEDEEIVMFEDEEFVLVKDENFFFCLMLPDHHPTPKISVQKFFVQNFLVRNFFVRIFSSDFFFVHESHDENEAFGRWARRRPSTKRTRRTHEKLSWSRSSKSPRRIQNRNGHMAGHGIEEGGRRGEGGDLAPENV